MDSDTAALIRRLEVATKGSRELDREVAKSAGWKRHIRSPVDGIWTPPASNDLVSPLPRFTTSVDAALTLVPDGWNVSLTNWSSGDHGILLRARARVWRVRFDFGWDSAATMPLAICIAALRAREAAGE